MEVPENGITERLRRLSLERRPSEELALTFHGRGGHDHHGRRLRCRVRKPVSDACIEVERVTSSKFEALVADLDF